MNKETTIVKPETRGRKPKSAKIPLEEQIELATVELEKSTRKLKSLKSKLEEQRKQELFRAFQNSDKSYEEICSFLKQANG